MIAVLWGKVPVNTPQFSLNILQSGHCLHEATQAELGKFLCICLVAAGCDLPK